MLARPCGSFHINHSDDLTTGLLFVVVGLPTRQVELPVRGGGGVLGTFILTPTPGEPISHERCVVALADQLGAALAAQGDHG